MIYHIMILLKNDYVRPTSRSFKAYVGQNSKDNSLNGNVNTSY